ncbi:Cro/CI family transcriptional regulator [Candidatus Glomeribacter gigasporarum]|uniref:transcriptional regulator n=1 Tax=Candidatus Glomeribacter gigasporarum TaxID=132144 RepID=UPI0009DA300D
MNGIEKIIKYFGSLTRAAHALNLSGYQVVQQWRAAGRVPPEHCPCIERLTNGEVRCEELNDRVDWTYLRTAPTQLPPSSAQEAA